MGRLVRAWPLYILVALLVAVLAACTQEVAPPAKPPHTVHMLIEPSPDNPQWFRDVEMPQGYDAYQLTELVTEGNLKATWYPAFRSHFVESLIGVENEGSNFWLSYLWNESSNEWEPLPVGADWFSVKDGHTLAWSYADTSKNPADPPTGRP